MNSSAVAASPADAATVVNAANFMAGTSPCPDLQHYLIGVNYLLPVLLPHRRMLPNSSRLLIDAHRPDVNRSLLTIGPTAFG